MQNFQALGAPPPDPQTSLPQLRISGYASATLCNVYNYIGLGSFCFEQFFLDRPVANLMMFNCRCMLNCFLVEKFYLRYALCDFDSIWLHCTNLFIRQSIDREKNFDVTYENPPLKNPAYATGRPPQLMFNDLFNQHFPWLIFLKYFVGKNRRGWR